MQSYVTVTELEARLADMEITDAMRSVMAGVLEDASNLARFHGKDWAIEEVPGVVRSIVLNAAMRHMRLIEGVVTSRAGDETLTWTDMRELTGTVFLDEEQRNTLKALAGKGKRMWSQQITGWSSTEDTVPWKLFTAQGVQYFATDDPWGP